MASDDVRDPKEPELAEPRRAEVPPISGGSNGNDVRVQMRRTDVPATEDQPLWTAIRYSAANLSFASYDKFIDDIMCFDPQRTDRPSHDAQGFPGVQEEKRRLRGARALPFPDIEPYRLLKAATEVFLMTHCGVVVSQGKDGSPGDSFPRITTENEGAFTREETERYYRQTGTLTKADINSLWQQYRTKVDNRQEPPLTGELKDIYTIPYLALISRKLNDVPIRTGFEDRGSRDKGRGQRPYDDDWFQLCYGILQEKLARPCFLELIWSYWHEEGMLVQTLAAISQRFQNIRGGANNPLAQLEISPLRPLNNLLWGYIQDEQHRLTVRRRVYEYDHHYGLVLYGKAVPAVESADSRSRFLEGLHNLLQRCAEFYRQDDDTTVVADGFPLLNALREVHLILSEGQHNQYGDLPWMARMEMLIQQWLLARTEFREFLPTRVMVALPEPWMDRVDAMKKLQSWTDTSVLHFHHLASFGEQILLSIRFGDWTDLDKKAAHAANWARYWRSEIQGYIHAYRTVTGVDLSDTTDTTRHLRYLLPSTHLRNRLAGQRPAALPEGTPAALPAGRSSAMPAPTPRALSQSNRTTREW